MIRKMVINQMGIMHNNFEKDCIQRGFKRKCGEELEENKKKKTCQILALTNGVKHLFSLAFHKTQNDPYRLTQ